MYIWSCKTWPEFSYRQDIIEEKCRIFAAKHSVMNRLYSSLDSDTQKQISTEALASETLYSSRIEGIELHADSVVDSISRQLGKESTYEGKADEIAEAVSKVTVDAVTNTQDPMTVERLLGWHSLLMKSESIFGKPMETGAFRNRPVFVVSGRQGNENIEFEGVPAERIEEEVSSLLKWIETDSCTPIVKSAIASFWFVTIHPFGNGNGRISRALSDFILSRFGDDRRLHYISISKVIDENRSMYYWRLKTLQNQNRSMDITEWIAWFIEAACIALDKASDRFAKTVETTMLMNSEMAKSLNARQRDMIYRLVSGTFFGSLTNKKWMKIEKCQIATATRDLTELVQTGLLIRSEAGGRSTSYELSPNYRDILK
ncbi:MAG: Fic family protein [Spirochaetales bacterium]|nr:Fic family protein [Spirochaetales bacterium]